MHEAESTSYILSLPAEIFTEIVQHVHASLSSERTEQKFVELRLVCRAFDDVVSREVFPRDRKNQFVKRKDIEFSAAKWLLLTKAKIHYRETRGIVAYMHECADFAVAHQAEWSRDTRHSYNDYLDAACHIVVANHGVYAVIHQMVFAPKRKANPLGKIIRMLRAKRSTLRPTMTPVDIHGAMQLAAVLGNSSAIETMVARGAKVDDRHPIFGPSLFAAASCGRYKTVSQLMYLGANLNERGHLMDRPEPPKISVNNTPLLIAAERNYRHVVNLMAGDPRLNINEYGGKGQRSIMVWMAERGWLDTAEIVLARGDANIDERLGYFSDLPIVAAVRHRNVDVLAMLLKASKKGINTKEYSVSCPMGLALVQGSCSMSRLLLEFGQLDPNMELPYWVSRDDPLYKFLSKRGQKGTPLVIAIMNDHIDLLKMLLSYPGVNPNLGSVTALQLAIAHDKDEVVKVLLQHLDKIEPSLLALGKPILHVAAANGAVAVMKMLVNEYAIDPNWNDGQGQTVLCSAIHNFQWKVVEYLALCPSVDVNMPGRSALGPTLPLQIAALQQNYIALGYLMKREDLDLNRSGKYGTALSIAVETSNQWAMKTLLYDSGVDVNRTSDSFQGEICVHRKMPPGSPSSWGFLGEEGVYGQDSPLSRAVKSDKLEAVQALLENHNVDPNVPDTCGRTPLWWASRGSSLRMARCILNARIKPNVNVQDMDGWTPLLCAANTNKDAMTRMLLDLPQIDPNIPNKFGWTPLHICANFGNTKILEQLMSHPKIHVWARTFKGETALDVAGDCREDTEFAYQMKRLSNMLAAGTGSRDASYDDETDSDIEL